MLRIVLIGFIRPLWGIAGVAMTFETLLGSGLAHILPVLISHSGIKRAVMDSEGLYQAFRVPTKAIIDCLICAGRLDHSSTTCLRSSGKDSPSFVGIL